MPPALPPPRRPRRVIDWRAAAAWLTGPDDPVSAATAAGVSLELLRLRLRNPTSRLRRHIADNVTEAVRAWLVTSPPQNLQAARARRRSYERALVYGLVRRCIERVETALDKALAQPRIAIFPKAADRNGSRP